MLKTAGLRKELIYRGSVRSINTCDFHLRADTTAGFLQAILVTADNNYA